MQMIKVRFIVLITFLIGLIHPNFSQENLDEGLFFSSHEVNQDKRTSLKLTPNKPIKTKEKISIEFYANFRRGDGYYGNIFKIIGNKSTNIDFVGNLSSRGDNFWLAVNNEILFSYKWENIPKGDYNKWIKFKLDLDFKNTKITFSANGYKLVKKSTQIKNLNSLEVEFGKSSYKEFTTSDVCPMSIKNIRIFNNENTLIRYWPLGMHTKDNKVYDEINNNVALAVNPKWLIDQHAFWKKNKTISFQNLLGTAVDKVKERIFFIEKDKLFIYDKSKTSIDTLYYNNYLLQCQSNKFFYNELKEELIAYSIDDNLYKSFDFVNLKWSSLDISNCKETAYLHHTKLVNPKDSTLLTFGGYGYYSYKSQLTILNERSKNWEKHNLDNKITPRYLSSSGVLDSNSFLIFGGYGSASGKQGVGSKVYKDLYSVSFEDYSVKKLWELKDNSSEPFVPVSSMVVDKNSNSFYTLIYNNSNYNTYLKLAKFSIAENNFEIYPDSIPFKYLDIKSNVDFFLNSEKTTLSALVTFDNNASLYSLSYPPLQSADIYQANQKENSELFWVKYALIALVLIVLIFVFIKKYKNYREKKELDNLEALDNETESEVEEIIEAKNIVKKSAIYLFGGFQVYDKNGDDITAFFTPTLKELFLIILLSSSNNKKGISSSKLTDLLWPNKSENNARNNRNVNISKLRILLSKIGEEIDLNNENTYWKIKIGESIFCDYLFVQNTLSEKSKKQLTKEQVAEILNLVSNGEISPDEHNDWIDDFKENIVTNLVDDLIKLSTFIDNNKLLLKLSTIVLSYAPLNEEAIAIKCQSLYNMGKRGSAKKSYNEFCELYFKILDSNFDKTFKELIS